MILAVDPGEVSGYAILNMEGVVSSLGQFNLKELNEFLDNMEYLDVEVLVIENFRIRPGQNFAWKEMDTIKVIGAFEYRAHQLGVKVVKQEPASYSIGLKWAGLTLPKDHSQSHQVVAYAHGTYYSHKVLGNTIPVARKAR